MRLSNKCSMALHILLVLAVFPGKKQTGETIARSVGCNPVMVRSLLGKLSKAGLVSTYRGTGGSTLNIKPENITIWMVYEAVDADSFETLIGLHPNPYARCPVGENIYAVLENPYTKIKDTMRSEMKNITLQQLVNEYNDLVNRDS